MNTSPFGLASPLRRDLKRDFAATDGVELLVSKVRQVLATEAATARSSGELPWRTSFGSALHLLRHQRNDVALLELARLHVRDALRRWLPEIMDISVECVQRDEVALMTVRYRSRDGLAGAVSLDAPGSEPGA